ncbi:hypothetical protein MBLNU459_g0855t1 [Dothideomycetes sp. NU459]
MSASISTRSMRQLVRSCGSRRLARSYSLQPTPSRLAVAQPVRAAAAAAAAAAPLQQPTQRCFSAAAAHFKGLSPDSEDPQPKESQPIEHVREPTPLEDEEYHERAEQYLDEIVARVEELQENKEDLELDYSAGVLNIVFPPNGTYVLNKQPPNKQIWLSSPITGPKRFDWVVMGESMQHKEESGVGEWIYLRDGTSLTSLLRKELGITVGETYHTGD